MVDGFDNFPAFLSYCKEYGRTVFVRAKLVDRWDNVPFGLLPPDQQSQWARRWWDEGRMPVRVVEE